MKKFLFIFVLMLFITSHLTFNAYANENTELFNTLKQVRLLETQLSFDFNNAFLIKSKNDKNTNKLLNQIKFQVISLDNLSKELRQNIASADYSEEYKQNALLLLLGLDYYKVTYQELQEYITNDNIDDNFDTLSRLSTQYTAGFNTVNWVEKSIKN